MFTGSTNFPGNHYIEKIVNKHQGEQNGVTKAFTTSFYFRIDNAGLKEFIPALVDAIRNPTFSEENILKEINNVNSEISMRMTFNKNMAYYKLLKTIGNPKSRLFQDGFANIDAASIDLKALRRQLLDFHAKHYSANIMSLSVVTDIDFRTVRKRVEKYFGRVPNKQVKREFFNSTNSYVQPFTPETFKRVYYLEGFTEPSKMTVFFQAPSDMSGMRFRALDFFSYFLNYFAEKSLKQKLIQRGLITSFSDTIALQDYVNSIYVVAFTLTPLGLERPSEILKEFFKFVEFVNRLPQKQEIFDDLAKASKYSFLFGVKSEFMDFSAVDQNYFDRAVDFSETLQDYPVDMVFTARNVMYEYNQTDFEKLLASLKPANAFYLIESPKFKKESQNQEKPLAERGLTQIPNSPTPADHQGEAHLKEFFSLKERPIVQVPRGRLLDDLVSETVLSVDDSIKPPVAFHSYFDRQDQKVVLNNRFDFDNGRMYTHALVPDASIEELLPASDSLEGAFETCAPFDTEHLNVYSMITRCHSPHSLNNVVTLVPENTRDVIGLVNSVDSQPSGNDGIRTERLFKAIFSDPDEPMETTERYITLRDLLIYKLCIIQDFDEDDKQLEAKMLSDESELTVHHRLFRKTLQPKSVLTLTIESQPILTAAMSSGFAERVQRALLLEVMCLYVMRHVEFEHRAEFVRGGDFSCRVANYRIVLQFEAFTGQLESLVSKVLGVFGKLTLPTIYRESIITNFKQRIVDTYSQFTATSSLKAATFYLNLAMDRIFIDNSTPDKVAQIRELVAKIDSVSLSRTMVELLTANKVYAMGVGNLEEALVSKVAAIARPLLRIPGERPEKAVDFLSFRKFASANFATKMRVGQHKMIRLPNADAAESNSVYLTYFRIKRMTRSVKVHALILNHFLKKLVYDHLRNNLNLGYVTQSGLKVYYRVSLSERRFDHFGTRREVPTAQTGSNRRRHAAAVFELDFNDSTRGIVGGQTTGSWRFD